jgi:hypothetical protein
MDPRRMSEFLSSLVERKVRLSARMLREMKSNNPQQILVFDENCGFQIAMENV